jgi:GR25 family glycosyltransferase involved in LPS biosynthesis
MVNNCLIINLDSREDLWDSLTDFRKKWESNSKKVVRIPGVNLKNETNVLLKLIAQNRINLNGGGFRKSKLSLLGELGCFLSHYNAWKYIVDNDLDSCLIMEDGVEFLRNDFNNLKKNSNNLHILFINEEMNKCDSNKTFMGYGLQGYVVTKRGASLLMSKCYTLSIPIDLQVRALCNSKELSASVISSPYLKRQNNRLSSIDNNVSDMTNLNEKQDINSLLTRLITNLVIRGINLDDFV